MIANIDDPIIFVATDGSQVAKQAFQQAMEFIKKKYHLIVCHISDPYKTYLPHEYKPATIYEEYKSECLSMLASNRYDLLFKEMGKEYTEIRPQLLDICKSLDSKYLFIGYSGRKGPKSQVTILSKTVAKAVQSSTVPLVVVKNLVQRDRCDQKGFNFMVCLDGSARSCQGMDLALDLATEPEDAIFCVFAPSKQDKMNENPIEEGAISEQFELFVKENNNKLESSQAGGDLKNQNKMQLVVLDESESPSQALIDYVNIKSPFNVDFIIFGNCGDRAQFEKSRFLGRTAEKLLTLAKANAIIVP